MSTPRRFSVTSGSESFSFEICSTTDDVQHALSILSQHTHVMLDCEGLSIGTVVGELSLLCLGTPTPTTDQTIFVLDMPALKQSASARIALVRFLTEVDITKVMFDGRMDKIEIDAALGIDFGATSHAGGVIDLQLAEVLARTRILKETEQDRRRHLAIGRFTADFVLQHSDLLNGIELVMGMDKCMERYVLRVRLQKDGEIQSLQLFKRHHSLMRATEDYVKAMHKANESYRWMQRPLQLSLLQYAATDIRALSHLYTSFVATGSVPASGEHLDALKALSARYVSRNGKRDRRPQSETFRIGALLFRDAFAAPVDTLLPCRSCGTLLPLSCFQSATRARRAARRASCRICVAHGTYQQQRWRNSVPIKIVENAGWVYV